MPVNKIEIATEPASREVDETHLLRHLIVDLLEADSSEDLSVLRGTIDVDLQAEVAVDSLRMVNIVLELEMRLGISIQNDELTSTRLRSVKKFADFLREKVAAANAHGITTPAR